MTRGELAGIFDVDGLLIDAETGEILDGIAPAVEDTERVALLATRRHSAHEQRELWKQQVAILDAALLRLTGAGNVHAGDVVVSNLGREYDETDAAILAASLADSEWTRDELFQIFAAAKFRRDELPPFAAVLYDAATRKLPTRRWIQTRGVMKPATARRGDRQPA